MASHGINFQRASDIIAVVVRAAAATMPPQIKQDLNRSGWESTDFPSVCENCLPDNPYVKMLKEDYGAECKLVSGPRCPRRRAR